MALKTHFPEALTPDEITIDKSTAIEAFNKSCDLIGHCPVSLDGIRHCMLDIQKIYSSGIQNPHRIASVLAFSAGI